MKIKSKPVVDAKEPLLLVISQADVNKGKKKRPDACAAAVAAVRQCKGALGAHVHLSRTYIEYPDKIVRYITPRSLRVEIVSFDRGTRFEKGEYELNAIWPAAKLGKQQGGTKNQTNPNRDRNAGNRRPYHYVEGVRAHAPKKTDWQ
jgi:hypothetical protein